MTSVPGAAPLPESGRLAGRLKLLESPGTEEAVVPDRHHEDVGRSGDEVGVERDGLRDITSGGGGGRRGHLALRGPHPEQLQDRAGAEGVGVGRVRLLAGERLFVAGDCVLVIKVEPPPYVMLVGTSGGWVKRSAGGCADAPPATKGSRDSSSC